MGDYVSDMNPSDAGVIAYLRTLPVVDPEESSQNKLEIGSVLEDTQLSGNGPRYEPSLYNEPYILEGEQGVVPDPLTQGKHLSGLAHSLRSTHQRTEGERMIGLIRDRANLQSQLAQLGEEMKRIQSCLEKVMQECRLKDVEIMRLEIHVMEAAMKAEGNGPSVDPAPLEFAAENPLIPSPSSLVHFDTEPDTRQLNSSVHLNFADHANYFQPATTNEALRDLKMHFAPVSGRFICRHLALALSDPTLTLILLGSGHTPGWG